MRFLANGPSIPDELLLARDEGRVVFFCGSGVSRAKANLDDFFGLAGKVLTKLRVPSDHSARKLLSEATSIEQRVGIGGLISADRIFALLEREFTSRDVENAVAEALQPPKKVDLSAHQIIVDLAKTQDEGLKLVTTNFDRLFEACLADPVVWCGPRLPDPSRTDEMTGLIYLHGRVTDDYSGAESRGFVLSSSEFGRAYLSEAWATDFVRSVIERYVVVFIGYSADDPPIQYLLEAMSVQRTHPHGVFAFQEGVSSEATGKWIHKGVRAIPYQTEKGHAPLWDTLAAWAQEARDPQKWQRDVITLATKGPQQLDPHERGQVAHIISTVEGARRFSENDPPPPADWLCVFDPRQRYATPSSGWTVSGEGPTVDPFPAFSIDSDEPPQNPDPNYPSREREVPTDAWNGLVPNRRDLIDAPEDYTSPIHGPGSLVPASIPVRLRILGHWMARVSAQAATPWWAAKKGGLHPLLQQRIAWQLERGPTELDVPQAVRQSWRYLFDCWSEKREPESRDWYDLKGEIAKSGWDLRILRKLAEYYRPYLIVQPAWMVSPMPPIAGETVRLNDVVHLDVKYPEAFDRDPIPQEFLVAALAAFRINLQLALQLEQEIGGRGLYGISPINAEDREDIDGYQRSHGLSGALIYFASLFTKLAKADLESARAEFERWPDNPLFSRLKIWAAADASMATNEEFAKSLTNLSDDVFWESSFQRDLLLSIKSRWDDLLPKQRSEIEKRLLKDESDWDGWDSEEVAKRKAWSKLTRIEWLRKSGCKFSNSLAVAEKRLLKEVPDWIGEFAEKAVESTEARGGVVRTDTTHDALLTANLDDLLDVAEAQKGRTDDFLVEADPYQGLVAEHPVRAFKALIRASVQGKNASWAWRDFLNSDSRGQDSRRFDKSIAKRLLSLPNATVAEFIRAVTSWLKLKSSALTKHSPELFDPLISKLTNVIAEFPEQSRSSLIRSKGPPDWVTEAINSPAGKLAEALMDDPRKDNRLPGQGFDEHWLLLADGLLGLPEDNHRFAYVIFCFNLNWFYHVDAAWTARSLIPAAQSENALDRDAFWAGFLWGARVPNRDLFVVLKPDLLRFATEETFAKRGQGDTLAGIILAGWGTKFGDQRLVSDSEMQDLLLRADESFRSKLLRQLRIWIALPDENRTPNWKEISPEFFQSVWPKQRFVRTPRMSSNLVDLLFENAAAFPTLVDAILPLLTPVEAGDFTVMPSVRSEARQPDIVMKHPAKVLDVLYAVLSEDAKEWPYEAEKVLDEIGDVDRGLRNSPKLIELNRRWNSR